MSVVLALDYGDQRIGVAVTDAEQQHALARGVVAAQPLSSALDALQDITDIERVERILVGLPRTLEGGEGLQARVVREFGDVLAAATSLPIEYIDERLTSRDAARIASEKGTAPDAEAARLILETWLERKRTTLPLS